MTKMIYDLAKFLVIWVMTLLAFSCVSTLIFGDRPTFDNLQPTIIYYFESSLGNWDVSAYDSVKSDEESHALITAGTKMDVIDLQGFGVWFLMFFLLVNMIILLNLVIAILGDTFNKFEPQTEGLYLSVLITKFPLLKWCDTYGNITCAYSPVCLI